MRYACALNAPLPGRTNLNDCYSALNASSNDTMAWSCWRIRWSTCQRFAVS